jgi:predicted RNase H-like nuclease
MTWLAGVDGCKKGWFRICRDPESRELRFHVLESVHELITLAPQPGVVALDMPIGLPDSGQRICDRAARSLLGPRRSSVFRAPIRPAVRSTSREEADSITRRIEGKGVGAQSWGIYRKINSVDEVLGRDSRARELIREVHPEVCFWAWNQNRPMEYSKKTPKGRRQREALAEGWLGAGILQRARDGYLKRDLADDDILDAVAGLWTAHRIADGTARTLPDTPPTDSIGRPMEIVF